MLRSSVAAAVLAGAAAQIFAPATFAKGKDHGEAHAARSAAEPKDQHSAKHSAKHSDSHEPAGDRDRRSGKAEAKPAHPSKVSDNHGRLGAHGVSGDRRGQDEVRAFVPACPPGLAKRHDGCLPRGLAQKRRSDAFGYEYRPTLFAIPMRGQVQYVYYDGYLVPVEGGRGSYIPLLGGALAVGQPWPSTYPSANLPAWQRSYYGFDEPRDYHSADNVVYRVDPDTAAIQAVAALLTGSDFTIGSPMPGGYDVYNVPFIYQSQYADSSDALYRYADGRVYQVDPATNLIARAIDLVL